jgi:glycosyltransferase involved in cell wall biosynthesis
MGNAKLGIILPIYRPKNGWKNELTASLTEISVKIPFAKVLLVNDGDENLTASSLLELKNKFHFFDYLILDKNYGKGRAIQLGLENLKADVYIYTDWDFPFSVDSVGRLYQKMLNENWAVCTGKRQKKYFENLNFQRKIISKVTLNLARIVLKNNDLDPQAGLKGLNKSGKNIFLQNKIPSFVFEIEFLRNCLKNNLQIGTMEVSPKEGIFFSRIEFRTLCRESFYLLKIIFGNAKS